MNKDDISKPNPLLKALPKNDSVENGNKTIIENQNVITNCNNSNNSSS